MITYRAMLDVPRELVAYLSRLLAAERRARGTRRATRTLTCWYQALLVLAWFRDGGDKTMLAAGFAISRATCYRYLAEGITVLTAQAPDLHEALRRVADQGWSHVILDGKLFATDRLSETVTSVKGNAIDAWYSGKHYEGTGKGIHTPIKQPADGHQLAVDNRTYNLLIRALRALGERGFALLTGRWRALRHTTASPPQPRRHRPRRPGTHPLRIPLPTGISLRSLQSSTAHLT